MVKCLKRNTLCFFEEFIVVSVNSSRSAHLVNFQGRQADFANPRHGPLIQMQGEVVMPLAQGIDPYDQRPAVKEQGPIEAMKSSLLGERTNGLKLPRK